MTVWIAWEPEIDTVFRQTYESMTGEAVQDNPPILEKTGLYLIGSSRCTEEVAQALTELGKAGQVVYFTIDPNAPIDEPHAPQEV